MKAAVISIKKPSNNANDPTKKEKNNATRGLQISPPIINIIKSN